MFNRTLLQPNTMSPNLRDWKQFDELRQEVGADPNAIVQCLRETTEGKQVQSISMKTIRDSVDLDERTVELSFSSETPYLRWYGYEVLGHKKTEVDTSRMDAGGAVLEMHDHYKQRGIAYGMKIVKKVGRTVAKFTDSAESLQFLKEVSEGFHPHISVGYFVNSMELMKENSEGPNEYRVTSWTPFEVSFVTVPADPTVGPGRAADGVTDEPAKPKPQRTQKVKTMTPEEQAEKDAALKAAKDSAQKALEAENALAAEKSAREAEESRVAEILALGKHHDQPELAREAINDNTAVKDFCVQLLDADGRTAQTGGDPNIGMDQRDIDNYDLHRALRYALNRNNADSALMEECKFEIEVLEATEEKLGRVSRGCPLPFDVLSRKVFGTAKAGQTREYNVGTPAEGGNFVATDLLAGSFVEMLNNVMALGQLGVTYLAGLVGDAEIPRGITGAQTFWLAEGGNVPTESVGTSDLIALAPKTLGCFSDMTRKWLMQSAIPAQNYTMSLLVLAMALEMDRVGIFGSGVGNEPLGASNATGVSIITSGGTMAPAVPVSLEARVAEANAQVGNQGYLTNSLVRGTLKTTELAAGTAQFMWPWNATDTPVNGHSVAVTNQVPSDFGVGNDRSGMYFSGNWSDLIVALWGALDLMVNPYELQLSGGVRVSAHQDADIAVRHGESFSKCEDITPTVL